MRYSAAIALVASSLPTVWKIVMRDRVVALIVMFDLCKIRRSQGAVRMRERRKNPGVTVRTFR